MQLCVVALYILIAVTLSSAQASVVSRCFLDEFWDSWCGSERPPPTGFQLYVPVLPDTNSVSWLSFAFHLCLQRPFVLATASSSSPVFASMNPWSQGSWLAPLSLSRGTLHRADGAGNAWVLESNRLIFETLLCHTPAQGPEHVTAPLQHQTCPVICMGSALVLSEDCWEKQILGNSCSLPFFLEGTVCREKSRVHLGQEDDLV
jgi:hypothetical protein